jgi:hypothetical protein
VAEPAESVRFQACDGFDEPPHGSVFTGTVVDPS